MKSIFSEIFSGSFFRRLSPSPLGEGWGGAFALLAMTFALAGCYDDQNGLDHDVTMEDVVITIPESAYSGSLGSTISITPEVKTSIAATDLEYHWEVSGARTNSQGREFFASLVNDEAQAETLNYTCHLDSNITTLNTSYECRLRVRQKSTGRDFYSADNFTITIEGLTGLMVLYADGSNSEIGVLQAEEFMPSSSSIPETPQATNGLFASNNGGQQLQGTPQSIMQMKVSTDWVSDAGKNRMRVWVRTSSENWWLDRNDLSVYGDWNAIFYLKGDRKVNDGDPKAVFLDESRAYVFDGDDMFRFQPAYVAALLFPEFTPETDFKGNKYVFAPYFLNVTNYSGYQAMAYANAVNGDYTRKGFVGLGNIGGDAITTDFFDTANDDVPFNPGDMRATLVKMFTDSRGHVVAVLKGDANNAQYAGKYIFVDMDPSAANQGSSNFAGIPQCLCDMSSLASVSEATAFGFGSTQNMYYYATKSAVYRYGLDGTTLSPAQQLCMADGSAIQLDGEITMMKMMSDIKNVSRHDDDEILLVATYNGSRSTLYAFHLDTMTGNVNSMSAYSADNVSGWNFGKIADVYIKAI